MYLQNIFLSLLALVKLSVNEESFNNALISKLMGTYMSICKHMCVTWIFEGADAQI